MPEPWPATTTNLTNAFGNALGNAAIAGIEAEEAHAAAQRLSHVQATASETQAKFSKDLTAQTNAIMARTGEQAMANIRAQGQAVLNQEYAGTEQALETRLGATADAMLARVVRPYGMTRGGVHSAESTATQAQPLNNFSKGNTFAAVAEANPTSSTTIRVNEANREKLFASATSMVANVNKFASKFRYGSVLAAVDAFSDLARPISAKSHFEVGANVLHDNFGYYLGVLSVSPTTTGTEVKIPPPTDLSPSTQFVAYTHTHTLEEGLSGSDIYWNQQLKYEPVGAMNTLYGDIGTSLQSTHTDAYAVLPSGAIYRFDYNGFMKAVHSGQWTVYAKDYITRVHP